MYPRQRYIHSPSVNKPQSYFSRILLPDERSKTISTPRRSKRSSCWEDTLSSPNHSKRHVSLPQWNFSISPDQTTDGSRMPTLFDFQPNPGYSSMAFKRHMGRGKGRLSQVTKKRSQPMVPVASSSETVERAIRILNSKKRTPLHLDTNASPVSDSPFRNDSVDKDSKRRCLVPSSYSLDVASVGIAKENDAFQFTSFDQLKQTQLHKDTTNINHVTNKDGYCSTGPWPVQRIMDAESSSFPSRERTPTTEVRSPLVETPKSASSIRRLIPYMSPAELDALFFNKCDKFGKYSEDNYENDLLNNNDDEFVGVSSHLIGHPRSDNHSAMKSEETHEGSEVHISSRSRISEVVPSSGLETTSESNKAPRIGSVARFIANLEACGRKLGSTTGLTPTSKACSVLSSSYHSILSVRSPSEISTRVDRIRKLLLSQSEQTAKLPDNSSSFFEKVNLPNPSTTTGFSSPLTFGSPNSTVNLTSTTETSTLASIPTSAPSISEHALTSTAKPSLTAVSNAITTSFNTVSSAGVSNGVPSSTISSTPTLGLSTSKTSDTVKVPSIAISAGAPFVASSMSVMGSAPTLSNAPTLPIQPVSTGFKFSFPNTNAGNTTPAVSTTVTSTNLTGLPVFSVPTTNSATSTAMTSSETTLPTTTSAITTTPVTTVLATVPQFTMGSTATSLPFGTLPVSSTTSKFSLPFGAPFTTASTVTNTQAQTTSSSGLFNFTIPSSSTTVVSSKASNNPIGSATSSLFPVSTLGTPSFSLTKTTSSTAGTTFSTAFSTASSPFIFSNPVIPSNTISSTSSLGFSSIGSSNMISTTTTAASVPSPFSFKPASIATTTTNTTNSASNAPAPPAFTFGKSPFVCGGSPTLTTSATTLSVTTTSNSTTQPAFTGFKFGSNQNSKPSTFNLFSAASTTTNQNTNTTSSSSSSLFTLGLKSASFTNTASLSTQPTNVNMFAQSQSTSTTALGQFTAVSTTQSTNPLPFSFGAPGLSTQLTSSATAPGQLFQFGVNTNKTTSSTTSSFTSPVTTTAAFSFGQQVATTGLTSSTSSNGFKLFGTVPGSVSKAAPTTSAPFLFGSSPALSNAGFNFSSPSTAPASMCSTAPVFGGSTGFNFGQPVSFSGPSTSQPNPFAFGTTPPAAHGAGGAVAIARRRPASARRTRRP